MGITEKIRELNAEIVKQETANRQIRIKQKDRTQILEKVLDSGETL